MRVGGGKGLPARGGACSWKPTFLTDSAWTFTLARRQQTMETVRRVEALECETLRGSVRGRVAVDVSPIGQRLGCPVLTLCRGVVVWCDGGCATEAKSVVEGRGAERGASGERRGASEARGWGMSDARSAVWCGLRAMVCCTPWHCAPVSGDHAVMAIPCDMRMEERFGVRSDIVFYPLHSRF